MAVTLCALYKYKGLHFVTPPHKKSMCFIKLYS